MSVRPRDRARIGHLIEPLVKWCPEAMIRVQTCEPDATTPSGYRLSDQANDAIQAKLAAIAKGFINPIDEVPVPPKVKESLVQFGVTIPGAPGQGGNVEDNVIDNPNRGQ